MEIKASLRAEIVLIPGFQRTGARLGLDILEGRLQLTRSEPVIDISESCIPRLQVTNAPGCFSPYISIYMDDVSLMNGPSGSSPYGSSPG